MAYQSATLGYARIGGFRLGYVAGGRLERVSMLLNGVEVRSRIRVGSMKIRDILNDAPNTCDFVINAPGPTTGQTVRILIGVAPAQQLLFNGIVQTVKQSYEGKGTNLVFTVTAIDDTFRANRRLPQGAWASAQADTVAVDLIAKYAPGFNTAGVQAGLPPVSVILDGSEGMNGALRQLATLIGGYYYFEDLSLHLFQDEFSAPPDPIDATHPFLNDPPIQVTRDISQMRNRVYGRGHGEETLGDIALGATTVPIADVVMFNPLGGMAIALQQVLHYTGLQQSAYGTVIGVSAAPSSAPSADPVSGTGNVSGLHYYGFTFITATGESLIGPYTAVVAAVTPDPTTTLTAGAAASGGFMDIGTFDYQVTFITAAGETLPGPYSNAVTTDAGPPAPVGGIGVTGTTPGSGLSGAYKYALTHTDSGGGETVPGPVSTITVGGSNSAIILSLPSTSNPLITGKNLYRSVAGGTQLFLVVAGLASNASSFADGNMDAVISTHAHAPTVSTVGHTQAPLSNIPIGSGSVLARRIYRRFNYTGAFHYVWQLSDNSTTTFLDTLSNASIGSTAAPTVSTAVAHQVQLSNIGVGPSGTTGRKLYRTALGFTQFKLLATLADNTTLTYLDNIADGSLGANVPLTDTSGLSIVQGQVVAGSITIPVASSTPFSASGGLAIIGSQIVSYFAAGGNVLTGVPASGPGSLLSTVRYGDRIDIPPALLGVSAATYYGSVTSGTKAFIPKGTEVQIWVQRDNVGAQLAQALIDGDGGDGVYEHYLSDDRRGEASLIAMCDADLATYSPPGGIVTVTYATRDKKTKSGKTVTINLTSPLISETLTIQEVEIDEINISPGGKAPRFSVTASSIRYSLDDLMRRLLAASFPTR